MAMEMRSVVVEEQEQGEPKPHHMDHDEVVLSPHEEVTVYFECCWHVPCFMAAPSFWWLNVPGEDLET
jgi:hypothetical protein